MALKVVDAQAYAAQQNDSAAERLIIQVYEMDIPEQLRQRSTAELLLALVSLRLGKPQVAADRAPIGVRNIGMLGSYVNPTERAYLKYAGRLIYEEATDQLGEPMTIDVGVEFDNLDARKVRSALRDAFPVYRSRYSDTPSTH